MTDLSKPTAGVAQDRAVPVLEACDLHRDYPVRRGLFAAPAVLHALAGVSFTVHAGRTLAVVGESGCGKVSIR